MQSDENPTTFPPVDRNSSQLPGQHWRDFFAAQARSNVAKATREKTPKERQARAQKEQHAARHLCPGAKGATVFVWEDIDGFRVRKAAGRKKYALIWEDYRKKERRYDAFYDEWDLCTEFGDDEGPSNGGGSSDDDGSSDNDSDGWFLGSTVANNDGLKDSGVEGTIRNESNSSPTVEKEDDGGRSVSPSAFDPPHYHERTRPPIDVGESVHEEVTASHAVQKEGENDPSVQPPDTLNLTNIYV